MTDPELARYTVKLIMRKNITKMRNAIEYRKVVVDANGWDRPNPQTPMQEKRQKVEERRYRAEVSSRLMNERDYSL